ncbi:hypothetical protein [Mariniphaga sp.]|uniref:hypothetical protein n=1 Tax=Mariniphaga sp. TaxID=1954475 RepID=UPI0035629720
MASEFKYPDIQPPITFNPHKHHFGFLKQQIEYWKNLPWPEAEKELLFIGTNLIDLYCGKLSIDEICRQCLYFAEKEGLSTGERLKNWLLPKEFRKIILSDNSEWVIKQGLDPDRFLHIHPAKYSPFTIRVRGSTLKTVVALKVLADEKNQNQINLQQVNQVRSAKLGLSPIKALEKGKGIARIWSFFNSPKPSYLHVKPVPPCF